MDMTTTPAHLLPESCHVCGHAPHADTWPAKAYGHRYWSNAAARAEFAAEAAGRTFAYSTGETTVEGQFVATTRGR